MKENRQPIFFRQGYKDTELQMTKCEKHEVYLNSSNTCDNQKQRCLKLRNREKQKLPKPWLSYCKDDWIFLPQVWRLYNTNLKKIHTR